MTTIPIAALALLATPLTPQSLVKDIYPGFSTSEPGSFPSDAVAVGSVVYFSASGGFLGGELWRTDGSESGTWLVADINPGSQGSNPENLFLASDGTVYFQANRAGEGEELWKTDGTEAGTQLVKDISPTSFSSPYGFTEFGGLVYFFAHDGVDSYDLWRTNGTEAGTELILDVGPGQVSTPAGTELEVVGGRLFAGFTGAPTLGGSLWATDGTVAGTELLVDLDAGSFNGPRDLVGVGSQLFFTATDSSTGLELWKSDGSVLGTTIVADIVPGPDSTRPEELVELGGQLFFNRWNTGELWTSDGTEPGTQVVIDIDPSTTSTAIEGIASIDGTLYFQGDDGTTGDVLWTSDGTAPGTQLVSAGAGNPRWFVEFAGQVYFTASSPSEGTELWRTDGTSGGTQLVADIRPGFSGSSPEYLTPFGTQLFFSASDGVFNEEPWVTDGTLAGTTLITNLNVPNTLDSRPEDLTAVGDRVFFTADDGTTGRELWITDGTEAGTSLLREFNPGPEDGSLSEFTAFGDLLFFVADDGVNGIEPWISDGTPAGTHIIRDIRPGISGSGPSDAVVFEGQVYFEATDGPSGSELWRSDGTEFGTRIVKDVGDADILLSELIYAVAEPTVFDGRLFYSHHLEATGQELFVSDGTTAGTGLFLDLIPGVPAGDPTQFVVSGDHLYFRTGGFSGLQVWRTDGTVAGTTSITPLYGNMDNQGPPNFVPVGDGVVYRTRTGLVSELWWADGKVVEVLASFSVEGDTDISGINGLFTRVGQHAILTVETAEGTALWASDGTVAGTQELLDLAPFYPNFTSPSPIEDPSITQAGSGPLALFSLYSGALGSEAWVSDGTLAGTHAITDIVAAGADSNPENYARLGNTILFAADNGPSGQELFSMPFSLTGGYVAEPFGQGCFGTGGLVPSIGAGGSGSLGSILDVTLEDAFPGAAALLLVSIDPSFVIPVSPECQAYIGTLLASLPATVDGAGETSIGLAIPAVPAVTGLQSTLQYAVADPGGAYQGLVSLSDALEVILGS